MTLPLQADLAHMVLVLGQTAPRSVKGLHVFQPAVPGSMLMGFLSGLHAAGAVEIDAAGIVHVPPDGEALLRRAYGVLAGGQVCRVCGCSDQWGCADGCWWIEPGLCSSCAQGSADAQTQLQQARYTLDQVVRHFDDAGTLALARDTLSELGGPL